MGRKENGLGAHRGVFEKGAVVRGRAVGRRVGGSRAEAGEVPVTRAVTRATDATDEVSSLVVATEAPFIQTFFRASAHLLGRRDRRHATGATSCGPSADAPISSVELERDLEALETVSTTDRATTGSWHPRIGLGFHLTMEGTLFLGSHGYLPWNKQVPLRSGGCPGNAAGPPRAMSGEGLDARGVRVLAWGRMVMLDHTWAVAPSGSGVRAPSVARSCARPRRSRVRTVPSGTPRCSASSRPHRPSI